MLSVALVVLLHGRLGVIRAKMERLIARYQAGKLWRRGPRKVVVVEGAVAEAAEARPRAKPVAVLPRQFGWLVRLAAWRAAVYGSQLRTVLHTPEMVELLRASPQAVRILRPLCRMLAVDPRYLQPGVVVGFVPPVAKVVKKRVRKPRPPVQIGRIPLPRGVLSWARRQGFGKVPRE